MKITKNEVISITQKNLKKSQIALKNALQRTGTTGKEITDIERKISYHEYILTLL